MQAIQERAAEELAIKKRRLLMEEYSMGIWTAAQYRREVQKLTNPSATPSSPVRASSPPRASSPVQFSSPTRPSSPMFASTPRRDASPAWDMALLSQDFGNRTT